MPTLHIHRLLIVVPVASVPAVVAWFNANIGPNAVSSDFGPPLNVTGNAGDAPTHHWCCGAFTDAQARDIFRRLCQVAGVTPPTVTQWNNATRQQKKTFVGNVRAGLKAQGFYVALMDNNGVWDDPATALTEMTLKVRGAAI